MTRDAAGFDAFYQATSRRMLLHVYTVCGDRSDAQDLTQEAYARAWQHWPKVSGCESPEAWVRTVAWRLAANRWRSARRRLAALTRLGRPDPAPPPSPDTVAVLAALRKLSQVQRRALVLHYLCELSVAEVADTTGQAVGTVKAQLSRGRTAMQVLLTDPAVDAGDLLATRDLRDLREAHDAA